MSYTTYYTGTENLSHSGWNGIQNFGLSMSNFYRIKVLMSNRNFGGSGLPCIQNVRESFD